MMRNDPNLELVNMNAYLKFNLIMLISFQDIERKRNSENLVKFCLFVLRKLSGNKMNELLTSVNGTYLYYKCTKMVCNNPNLELVDINAYTEFGEILLICSKDIERKQKPDGPTEAQTGRMLDNQNPV